ncbi:hypothetical protein D3C77_85060 [compost metagenome]
MSDKTTSKATGITKPKCFVIMPISSQSGYDIDHFTLVYDDIIKPAILIAGLEPSRADETINTNLIQLDILRKVIESDIAICDMSSKNPNVFYELGLRQAFDRPTVLMRDDTTDAPFDVASLRYVTYNKDMKYRDVKIAIDNLSKALIDTYAKREDKSEINSLIRLMELTTPAQLSQTDLSDEVKTTILHEFQFSELMGAVQQIKREQAVTLNEIKRIKRNIPELFINTANDFDSSAIKIYSNETIEKIEDIRRRFLNENNEDTK